ncbi:MAG: ornithine cyclodeaminase family protein [Caldiserica bacterium]|jgi:ornithine cyclodeaminase|nr:ornithine cyclodeaminase family protein [Caldisericota bacterium]
MADEFDIQFLYLNQKDVLRAGLTMKMAISAMERALSLFTEGKTIMPYKTVLDLDERKRGRINAMPAYIGGEYDIAGIKWIGGFPPNVQKGLPRATALIILNDAWTGFPIALMDSTLISAVRTGAVTGVGAKYLARKDSKVVGMIGAGVQARTQLEALIEVLPLLEKVKVFDIRTEASRKYATEMAEKTRLSFEVVESPEEAVVGSDIVVTVTVADEPIVKEKWLKEGSFFAAVGSYREEEDEVVLKADKIVVDGIEHVIHRETPIIAQLVLSGRMSKDRIHGEMGEIILGRKSGRENPSERIFFSPIGMAVDDIVLAKHIYDLAVEKGIGQRLSLIGR